MVWAIRADERAPPNLMCRREEPGWVRAAFSVYYYDSNTGGIAGGDPSLVRGQWVRPAVLAQPARYSNQ